MAMPAMAPLLRLELEDDVDPSVVVLEEPEARSLLPNSKAAAGCATGSWRPDVSFVRCGDYVTCGKWQQNFIPGAVFSIVVATDRDDLAGWLSPIRDAVLY